MNKIDYTKLNEQVVRQAYKNAFLNDAEYRALIEAKVARTQALLDARGIVVQTRTKK